MNGINKEKERERKITILLVRNQVPTKVIAIIKIITVNASVVASLKRHFAMRTHLVHE